MEKKSNVDAKVIKALENPEYKWRTIHGVSVECGIPEPDVAASIRENEDIIVQSSSTTKQAEVLFTTRKHFREKATIRDRLASILMNTSSP